MTRMAVSSAAGASPAYKGPSPLPTLFYNPGLYDRGFHFYLKAYAIICNMKDPNVVKMNPKKTLIMMPIGVLVGAK